MISGGAIANGAHLRRERRGDLVGVGSTEHALHFFNHLLGGRLQGRLQSLAVRDAMECSQWIDDGIECDLGE